MPNVHIDREIRARIEDFVAELTELVRAAALEAVHGALGGATGARPVRRSPARPRKNAAKKAGARPARRATPAAATPGKRIRRTTEDLQAIGQQVVTAVRAEPGIRMEKLSAGLGIATKDLKRPIELLIGTGALRTTGQKRGTQYFPGSGGRGKKARAGKRGKGRKTAKRRTRKKAAM
ncbi:MAG: hypothetical protein AB1726_04405 [Planctomycetota bacterium]